MCGVAAAKAGVAAGPLDRGGREVIHAGDTVSILSPAAMPDHDGVGDVTVVDGQVVTVTDSQGRDTYVNAWDVSVDWTDYPPS